MDRVGYNQKDNCHSGKFQQASGKNKTKKDRSTETTTKISEQQEPLSGRMKSGNFKDFIKGLAMVERTPEPLGQGVRSPSTAI